MTITCIALSIGFFIAMLVFYYMALGGLVINDFSSILSLIYFIFEGGILAYLLVTNINNDPRAYHAIMIWVFWYIIGEIQTLFFSYSFFAAISSGAPPLQVVLLIAEPLVTVGCLALGIMLYIMVRRYMFGSLSRFSIIRRLAIGYACASLLSFGIDIALTLVSGGFIGLVDIFSILSKTLADVAVIFTLERLAR